MNRKIMSNALLMATLAMSGQNFIASGCGESEPVIYIQKPPIQPKGTKQYFFDEYGEFTTVHMRKDICVFICFSINDKNAIKKFEQWKKTRN